MLHWDFQGRLARAGVEGTRLRYQSVSPFGRDESDAWWLAADALVSVDRELRQVDLLLQDLGRPAFAVKGVLGAGDPERLRQSVKTTGWEPVDARLTVSDVTSLVRRMGGRQLYGAKPTVPIREMIQNAADAINARKHLQPGWEAESVDIAVIERDEWLAVEVRDNGVGMAPEMLAGPLLDFGRSLWRDPAVTHLLPRLAASEFESIGRFGIGFFSVFMFDRPVRVRSRFYTSGVDQTYVLDFPAGLSRRALLRLAEPAERMAEPGTIVSFEVHDPEQNDEPSALRNETAVALGQLCPTLEANLRVVSGSRPQQVLCGGDWCEIDAAALIRRIGGQATPAQIDRLRPLFGEHGETLGRLVAIPAALYFRELQSGVLTVGGLEARRGGSMIGVLLGGEPNLARSQARALVSAEAFARWATEQAALWLGAGLTEEESIGLAAAVARYGGDIGDLPICFGAEGPMSRSELTEWASERERIFFWEHIDNDELRIPGGYEPKFMPGPDTIVIGAPVRSSDLGETVTSSASLALTDWVRESIAQAWNQTANGVMENSAVANNEVIGESEVDDIFSSTALVFQRSPD